MSETSTRPPLPAMAPFGAFYEAVNGREPFPWQSRLADLLGAGEPWPEQVAVPTGLGKTGCLDVAIWWLASQAHLEPSQRDAPTRVWWLSERRPHIDSTLAHAQHVAKTLATGSRHIDDTAGIETIRTVAERLRSLTPDPTGGPVQVVGLRATGAAGRPADPSQPAIILSTVPMYASRLLFRGYGSARSMRPIDAAHAGTDSLIVADEARHAAHLRGLIAALWECAPPTSPLLAPPRNAPRIVTLTATGRATTGRFELDETDNAHPEISERLDAVKPTKIHTGDKANPVRPLTDAALDLLGGAAEPTTCVIFVNASDTARAVKARLLKDNKQGLDTNDVVVATGEGRDRETEAAQQRIAAEMTPGDTTRSRARHFVVVATQTLESAANIDAELLVTQACGVRALTGRLGRMNRLGRHQNPQAIYVHCPPPKKGADAGWPSYGTEPAQVLERLQVAADWDNEANLASRHLATILGEPGDEAARTPEILPGLLWEWTKTTTPPPGEAPVEPYFSGTARPEPSASLIWRSHTPDAGQRLWPPPRTDELVVVPVGALRETLRDDHQLRRLASDGSTVEHTRPADVRPGDMLVLATDRGLLDADGWAPESAAPVADMSILPHGLPLHVEALRRLCDDHDATPEARLPFHHLRALLDAATGNVDVDEPLSAAEREHALTGLLDIVREHPPPDLTEHDYRRSGLADWAEYVSELRTDLPPVHAPNETPHLRRIGQRTARSDEHDESSLAEAATDIDTHSRDVATRAARIATAIGVPADMVATLELAGTFHDVGKVDERFQRWLDPAGTADRPVAKTDMAPEQWAAAGARSGWPTRGRHEDLSARLVRARLFLASIDTPNADMSDADGDLLVHLVVSHHGSGRPLVPPADDGTLIGVTRELRGVTVSCPADLSIIDWTQPSRFKRLNDLYGPWGLALLEAALRQADHATPTSPGAHRHEVR